MGADPRNGQPIVVVGGGMSGLSAAVEAAEAGFPVVLVEKEASLGGRVARMAKYFPKLCPPSCGLEINYRRLRGNPLVRCLTLSEVVWISGEPGALTVTVRTEPRYVTEKCTGCGACESAARTRLPNSFDYGMSDAPVVGLPHAFAYPARYRLSPEIIGTEEAEAIRDACPYGAIDLDMQAREFDLDASAVIWATGWRPYGAERIGYAGFGMFPNLVTNVMMERLAAPDGPTGGRIVRPDDGSAVKKVAFIQCAGSRDENHLPYCSGVCCLATLKQADMVLEANPEARVFIYFIDIRAFGRYEDVYARAQLNSRIMLVKGKPGEVVREPATGRLSLQVEDQGSGTIVKESFDLVVLATGMVPNAPAAGLREGLDADSDGFLTGLDDSTGVIPAGCVKRPMDVASSVRDATGAVMRAIRMAGGR